MTNINIKTKEPWSLQSSRLKLKKIIEPNNLQFTKNYEISI